MKKARLIYDRDYEIGLIDPRLFGSFVEHLGRCCYGGIYEPMNKNSDALGFRNDVKELVREAGITGLRYPGGNFVSGYDWKDGIGPRNARPVKKDLAWGVTETNEVGTDEFMQFAKDCGTEVYMAVNLGTGTPMEAGEEVEYCNGNAGTKWADERVKNGHASPYGIRTWCLGNEMDGSWQICAHTPQEYARLCRETAKIVKWEDPNTEVIACGSCTNEVGHAPFGIFDRTVLEECYDVIDYLSIHRYLNYRPDKKLAYPCINEESDVPYLFRDLQNYIDAVNGAIRLVKEEKHSEKTVRLSFDEWGVITETGAIPGVGSQNYGYASFSALDAVVYGGILCTLLNNADTIRIACQSLLVNEGGMISTDPNGKAIRQTTFYPFCDAAHFGRGIALRAAGNFPKKETGHYGSQITIQTVAAYDPKTGMLTVFAANTDGEECCMLDLILRGFGQIKGVERRELHSEDPSAVNTFEDENRVIPTVLPLEDPTNGVLQVVLKPYSWNVFRFQAKEDLPDRP